MPTYGMGPVGGQPHQRNFAMVCTVGKLKENGTGGSKKDAKREAAQKMIDKLKSCGPNNSPAQASEITHIDEEEVLSMLSNMKVETLNGETSEKVSAFYKNLQTANGKHLARLHVTSLKSKTHDYQTMLKEISTEQKFDVTYVEVDEKTEDGEVQCLVQVSTLPVAVCYAVGPDIEKARVEAARITLNYLKMMTKRSAKAAKK
jgi:RISC-loading complex subunit TARBP2